MKVVYITSPAFFDADLSFVNELRKVTDLTVLIDLPSFALHATALSISKQPEQAGIYPISEIKEFAQYLPFLGENCFVINRPVAKRFSLETLVINRKIKRFLNELHPDLIHLNNPVTQFGRAILKFPVKKVMTIHDPVPHIGEHQGNLKIRDWNMKYVKHYILLNVFQKEAFISNYKLKAEQVHQSFLSAFNWYQRFKSESTSKNEFRLLFFGRITPYKGIDLLLEAFTQLRAVYPQLRLTIAGKGELPDTAKKVKGVSYINRHVPVEELSQLINSSDLVVCPYVEGTQSGVIMTGFAFSKPVLATRVGGFHEMIDDGFTGFLAEPESVSALTNKLTEIMESPEKLSEISKNIAETYHTGDKTWKMAVEKTLDIYKTIQKDGF